MKIFNLESEEELKVRSGGINHFYWILDFSIRGENGYELLKYKMKDKTLNDFIAEVFADEPEKCPAANKVSSELFHHLGCLSSFDDRHICEFFPMYLTPDDKKSQRYGLKRTSIEDRRRWKKEGRERVNAYIRGTEKLPDKRSRETAADIIDSFVRKKEFIDIVNLPNRGQIANLPDGSVVETLGVINSAGFTPLTVGALPEPILNLVLPHVRNQDMIVEAALEHDLDKALKALYNDPMCSHLTLSEVKEMGLRLLKANEIYLPDLLKYY